MTDNASWMRQTYGATAGRTCVECAYYQPYICRIYPSRANRDVKQRDPACGKFEEKEVEKK